MFCSKINSLTFPLKVWIEGAAVPQFPEFWYGVEFVVRTFLGTSVPRD